MKKKRKKISTIFTLTSEDIQVKINILLVDDLIPYSLEHYLDVKEKEGGDDFDGEDFDDFDDEEEEEKPKKKKAKKSKKSSENRGGEEKPECK